jgi:hypothetical protein
LWAGFEPFALLTLAVMVLRHGELPIAIEDEVFAPATRLF